MPVKSTVWDLQPHTRAKHAILKEYLGAWLPILSSHGGPVLFIDAFAGPGCYSGGEPGSPVIALETAALHVLPLSPEVRFVFIERDENRFQLLNETLASLPFEVPRNIKLELRQDTFVEGLQAILTSPNFVGIKVVPSFAFIDPFGFSHAPLKTIRQFAAFQRTEVLITFMLEEVVRFLGEPDRAHCFDELFGTGIWRDVLNSRDRGKAVHELYLSQLRDRAFRYVISFRMVNKFNKTDYFLVYGTNSLKGLEVMKDAMWKVDRSGEYRFSDFADPNQPRLFDGEPSASEIESLLRRRFGDREFTIAEAYEVVLVDSRFRWSGIKSGPLAEMEKGGRLQVVSSPRTRARVFPEGTRMKLRQG